MSPVKASGSGYVNLCLKQKSMKALVIGATGAVGKDLVQQLLADDSFERVDIFVRREVKFPAEKLVVHVVDWMMPFRSLASRAVSSFGPLL